MIYVSKDQLCQVEYLIQQSSRGNHVLFDAEAIRRHLGPQPEALLGPLPEPLLGDDSAPRACGQVFSESDAYSVEHHLERVILQPTLEQKRAYLEALDPETYGKVVQTYFNIVENSLYEKTEARH